MANIRPLHIVLVTNNLLSFSDGIRLPVNHRQKVFSNGTLQVKNVDKKSDGGRYTCIAFNADGARAENSLHVSVLGMYRQTSSKKQGD